MAARRVDITDSRAIEHGFTALLERFGRIDCVVANAGIAGMAPTTDMSDDMWHAVLGTNLHGAFYTLREAARRMIQRTEAGEKGGSLIICGSGANFAGVAGLAHYAAAKNGLVGVMRTMAVELGRHEIRINMIAPGYFITEMTRANPMNDEIARRTPIARVGDPAELEGIVAYLASDAARFHTGDIINIDGGWQASHF